MNGLCKLIYSMVISILFLASSAHAQHINNVNEEEPVPYVIVDEKPLFQGGDCNNFSAWLSQQIIYPEIAKQNGIQGRVVLSIVIQKDGNVGDLKVLRGEEPSLVNEAIRVVLKSPKWTPGKHKGHTVPVTYTFPLVFTLPKPNYNSHEYVDLGLSVKWATCNIGADNPEDFGNYYAWGEVNTKFDCSGNNSKTYGKKVEDITGNPIYDTARANWGGDWRLPTKDEFMELVDNCIWIWTNQNGRNGYKITSKRNGKSIFLPAAGSQYETNIVDANERGHYWTSTPDVNDPDGSFGLYFHDKIYNVVWNGRWGGECVRPVKN